MVVMDMEQVTEQDMDMEVEEVMEVCKYYINNSEHYVNISKYY